MRIIIRWYKKKNKHQVGGKIMASEIVRNIRNVKNIDMLSDNITEENDIISDVKGNIYIRKKKGYHKLYDGDGSNIDDKINDIVKDLNNLGNNVSKIDLTLYAKKSDLVEYLTSEDLTLYAKKSDLDNFTTKSDLTLYAKISDLDKYTKKSDLATYVQVTDLNDYAKKSELPDLTTYAKKSELPDLTTYAKKSELNPLSTGSEFTSPGAATQDLINNATTGIIYLTKMIGVNDHDSSNAGYLVTLERGGYKKQLWLPFNTTNHLTRFYNGSVWSDWVKQLSQADFDNLQAQINALKA